jgi:hypothetical protein
MAQNNLRVVYDNAANRATLSASSTAGALVVDNLYTDTKSEVWRSTSTSATLTLTWGISEIVGVVSLPFCSLTAQATFRIRGYTEPSDVIPKFDTGIQYPCAGSLSGFNWGMMPLGVNSYAYGGATYGTVWFTPQPIKQLVVDIDDSTNTLGYIEASKVIAGSYWEPANNAESGSAQISVADTSKNERSDAGDLKTDRGTTHKVLSFDLNFMTTADRNALGGILKGSGMFRAVFISLTPNADDATDEQTYQIYGKMSKQSSIRYQFVNQHSSQLEIEEI